MFIQLFLLTLAFTHAFAVSPTISLPILFGLAVFFGAFAPGAGGRKPSIHVGLQFGLAISFLFLGAVGAIFRSLENGFEAQTITHLIAFTAVFVLFLGGPGLAFRLSNIPIDRVLRWITYGVLLVACFVLAEFVAKNFLQIPLDNLLPRPSVTNYEARYFIGPTSFFRSRGFASESGHTALFLIMFLPIVISHLFHGRKRSTISSYAGVALIGAAVVTTFSAAVVVDLAIGGTVTALLFSLRKRSGTYSGRPVVLFIFALAAAVTAGILSMWSRGLPAIFDGILTKLQLEGTAPADRSSRWEAALSMFRESPIWGNGIGSVAIETGTGSTSFFLEILAEAGLIGFALIAAILLVSVRRILMLGGPRKWAYLLSFTIAIVHYNAISDYWYPWLWVLLAVVNYEHHLERVGHGLSPQVRDGTVRS